MTDLTQWLAPEDLALIRAEEQTWLAGVFGRFNGYPTLEQLWALMDELWRELGCSSEVMDARIAAYYAHPIWLLNGLFIEQHSQSLENRRRFTDWVIAQAPRRVADYGGGFGGLARMIGEACPNAVVEIIEPHPHPLAIARTERTANVRYRAALEQDYDILIATDVFEHVPDPLALVAETAATLKLDGKYLIANCFEPVILCHLPQTFHFHDSWGKALEAMGLEKEAQLIYGYVFKKRRELNIEAARRVERYSRLISKTERKVPAALQKFTKIILRTVLY